MNNSGAGQGSPPGVPLWVKLVVVAFLLLVAAVIVLHITGNGFGGPGGHNPFGQ
jgi:hypothetical protein